MCLYAEKLREVVISSSCTTIETAMPSYTVLQARPMWEDLIMSQLKAEIKKINIVINNVITNGFTFDKRTAEVVLESLKCFRSKL